MRYSLTHITKKQWFSFWLITGLEGLFACALIVALPSDQGNDFLFGLSKMRLLLFGAVLTAAGLCLLWAVRIKRSDASMDDSAWVGWMTLLFLYILMILLVVFLSPLRDFALIQSLFQRLSPLLLWLALFSIQSLFLFSRNRSGCIKWFKKQKTAVLLSLFLVFVSGCAILTALQTGVGLEIISGTFYRQGVSLLEGQLILPVLILFPILILSALVYKRTAPFWQRNERLKKILGGLIPWLIWLAAAVTWIETPFEGRSYFLPALRPPNQNFYPASDAEGYDMLAQSILIGNGFRNGMTVVRPLYVAFLALLHTLAGNDYLLLTNLQIVVLAIFPAVIYLIGREIRLPAAGFIASIWLILREVESIRLTPLIQISNSRLLMSDMPMALVTALILLVAIRWYRGEKASNSTALITGGLCGVGMLIRTQSFVLVPAALCFFLIGKVIMKKMNRHGIFQCFLLIAGCLLVFSPWQIWNRIYPNESISGQTSEADYLYRLYERAAAGESPSAPADEFIGNDAEKPSLLGLIVQNPQRIFASFSAHFFNNEFSTLLVLPVRTETPGTIESWFHDPSLFWYRESSRDALAENTVCVLIYLSLICIGIGYAFHLAGWAGLLPLWIHLFYNAGTAAALNSGFRFVFPVDWVGTFYFASGLAWAGYLLIRIVFAGFFQIPQFSANSEPRSKKSGRNLLPAGAAAACLLGIGLILPLSEVLIPFRYQNELIPESELFQVVSEASSGQICCSAGQLRALIDDGKLIVTEGRAVYPRFYPSGEGDSGGSAPIKQWADYDRLIWMLVNRRINTVSLPVSATAAFSPIADPMDGIVIGTPENGFIDAWWIVGINGDETEIWQSAKLEENFGAM